MATNKEIDAEERASFEEEVVQRQSEEIARRIREFRSVAQPVFSRIRAYEAQPKSPITVREDQENCVSPLDLATMVCPVEWRFEIWNKEEPNNLDPTVAITFKTNDATVRVQKYDCQVFDPFADTVYPPSFVVEYQKCLKTFWFRKFEATLFEPKNTLKAVESCLKREGLLTHDL